MIKTQHIIAPYQCDPDTWVLRVAWLHNRLVAYMDAMPCIVVSNHTQILAGCYGDDEDEDQRRVGLRATLLHVGHTAMGYGNELFIILPDDETPTDGMVSQMRVWRETRNDFDHPMNVYAGTWQHWLDEFEAEYNPAPTPLPDTQQTPAGDDDSEDYTEI